MLKIIGICILLFAMFCIFYTQRQRERRRLILCEQLSLLLHFVRRMVGCYLKPLPEIIPLYHTDEPEIKALAERISKGEDVYSAADSVLLAEKAGDGASRIFCDYIDGFGKGYLSDELSRTDNAIAELDKLLAEEREMTPKRLRLLSTLCVASSLGMLILFI